MADEKISNLTALTTPADDDDYVTVDVSDTTQADSGTTKKITWANIKAALLSWLRLGSTIIPQNSPRGFLINGKIVPSVSSNNLTVALKGLDGNDPSSSNPVYCRIGDNIRTITSALSVTRNAGTNWFNAGSSELATKEIDYFVYLGYNATDGVTIGFARIPYASEYGDFSTTSTNEKYCAISTTTNAQSGDCYEVIGRFAATLSGGSGYTWSVPTFNNKNLIQRPIYKTRMLSWQPSYSAGGSMTYTSVSTKIAKYTIIDNTLFLTIRAVGTTGGTASDRIFATVPFSAVNYDSTYPEGFGVMVFDNTGLSGVATLPQANMFLWKKYDGSNWNLGTEKSILGSFTYFI